ncbi:type IIL restriction-modification enzyme MmeI [Demequina gelatinilytica]|uniref:type IIL restriction-modification enzyme MmeI n=1 Tax=Demequina gelatinilytica TaxID=1638980 RepID=UPI0007854813|nr:type IIL restriction-modification enzyme MmeI [Demequina gelatinilytica]
MPKPDPAEFRRDVVSVARQGGSIAQIAKDPALLKAHADLDKAVDSVFGLTGVVDEADRLRALFSSYAQLSEAEQLRLPKARSRKK